MDDGRGHADAEGAGPSAGRLRPAGLDAAAAELAAAAYVDHLAADEMVALRAKPIDRNPGNPSFYDQTYQAVNMVRALDLPAGARILEGGCGAGWLTELLALLGFEVDALDPSEQMLRIAQERVRGALSLRAISQPAHLAFHRGTLEATPLAPCSVDAVLLHEALHHVVDERLALSECFRVLRPGGVLGISGETNWRADDPAQTAFFAAETERFGTYEGPFQSEYLLTLLEDAGFVQVTHHHGLAGLFPVELEQLPIAAAAAYPAGAYNTVVGYRPGPGVPNTADPRRRACGTIDVAGGACDEAGWVGFDVRVHNRGRETWLHRYPGAGRVTLAVLGQDAHGPFELGRRIALPQRVDPGQSLQIDVRLAPATTRRAEEWQVHLVCEHLYWFSDHGTRPGVLKLGL